MMSQVVGHGTQPETFAARQALRSHDDQVTSMVGRKLSISCRTFTVNAFSSCGMTRRSTASAWDSISAAALSTAAGALPSPSSTPNKVTRVAPTHGDGDGPHGLLQVSRPIDRNGDVFDGVVVVSDQQWSRWIVQERLSDTAHVQPFE